MALQNRYGEFKDFDPNKMVTAELAVVVSGDPASPTGRTMYVCFAPGVVKRITTYEDFENELQNATEEIRKEFTEDIQTAIENSIAATTAANAAKEAADRAAEAANAAAEAAGAYVLGDISEKTVTFETAAQRAGIESGDSLSVAFGKLAKFCSDLDQHAFNPLANNLTTNTEGYGIDARQGPVIDKKISDVQTSVDELNTNMFVTGAFSGSWLPGFFINGMGFTVIIPKHSKKHTLTITSARIFTLEGGWVDTAISTIADMPNCWRVILKTDAAMKLTSGYAYIADLAGQIK